MTFSERMRELLDQGVAASKGFAAKAGAKAQDLGERGVLMLEIRQLEGQAQKLVGRLGAEAYRTFMEQGVTASRKFAVKAGAKAQDLGERGVLMLEIKQLEGQAQKLIGRLGAEAYQTFTERGETTLSAESTPIKTFLTEIAAIRESVEQKEAELKSRKSRE